MFITGDTIEGAFGLALIALIGKIFSSFRRDKNKELDASLEEKRIELKEKELEMKNDEQEAQQEERKIPFYERLIDRLDKKVDNLDAELKSALGKISELAITLAEAKGTAIGLESRVKMLENELNKATARHEQDQVLIADLRTKLALKENELDDAHSLVNELRYEMRQVVTLNPPTDPLGQTQPVQ